jgi:precorrin-2 dehydrogenase/sirohydrochlorin ferrochelatase
VTDPRYYMACLDLDGRRCLVVGGGTVGLEKARGLLDCGAVVTVVAPQIEAELQRLPVRWRNKRYEASDLDGNFLVVAATSNRSVNRRVFRDAEERSLLCNVVDTPEHCSFILPAVFRRDPIAIAVSTGGASPALAKRLRDELGAQVGEEHVTLARRLRDLRPWVKRRYPSYGERRDFFEAVVEQSWGNPGFPHRPPPSALSQAHVPRPPAGQSPAPAATGTNPTASEAVRSTTNVRQRFPE